MKRKPSVLRAQGSGSDLSVAHSSRSRAGATLLVTLGVLTVLSVMVITFLLTSRHQSLSAKHISDKNTARRALDVALACAMQFADDALVGSNYNQLATSTADKTRRRLAPLGRWYSANWETELNASKRLAFQTQDILLYPVTNNAASFPTNALSVDLLTPEVRRLLPPALTNRMASAQQQPLRSGWVDFGIGARLSFAILNVSGFIDAHACDFSDPQSLRLKEASRQVDRAFFARQDLVNAADLPDDDTRLDSVSTLSYDPGRDAVPLAPQSNDSHPLLGRREFAVTNKFDINSISNFFIDTQPKRLRATVPFEELWLKPVTNALEAASRSSGANEGAPLGNIQKVAWNIANYLTPSRVPVISFPGVALPSRADYGVEDVPLINEVCVFKCTQDGNGQAIDGQFSDSVNELVTDLQARLSSYGSPDKEMEPIIPTNLYAAAVEVWYPFEPRAVPGSDGAANEHLRVYVGVYTNKGDVSTTTNTAWSSSDLAEYYGLNNPTLAQLYLHLLNSMLVNDPDYVTNSDFWAAAQNDPDLLALIENPASFNETNLTVVATGLASALIAVYTDPADGSIPTNNPYASIIRFYAPADTNIYASADAVSNYYGTASNYVPAVTTYLTNRLYDIYHDGGGRFIDETQTIMQRYLPPDKVEVAGFPKDYFPEDGESLSFNSHGFCAVTNTKTLISFPALEETEKTRRVVFYELGSFKSFHTWIRPLVAIKEPNGEGSEEHDGYEAVDEALLTEEGGTIRVREWEKPNSLGVADPRVNGWSGSWQEEIAPTFGGMNSFDALDEDDGGPTELPFIHRDAPFLSIGELGHITVDIASRTNTAYVSGESQPYRDTVNFATRAGAAMLDHFTTSSSNAPLYGLIQANTTYPDAVRAILSGTVMGWTNALDSLLDVTSSDDHSFTLGTRSGDTTYNLSETLVRNWTNVLLKAWDNAAWDSYKAENGLAGWSSFADMLPDLSTNARHYASMDFSAYDKSGDFSYYRHDYIEDVMRGIVDKVSFRQNIFVVVVAAQTLSPASTAEHPIILADQRAAVTVIRDSFTGRWMIYNWAWLTE